MGKSKKKDIKLTNKEKNEVEYLLERLNIEGLNMSLVDNLSNPIIGVALIEKLPKSLLKDPEIVIFLKQIKNKFSNNNEVKKAIKRICFKLKQKGIDVRELYYEKDEFVSILLQEKNKNRAYVSHIFGSIWQRILIFQLYINHGNMEAAVAFISDIEGIKEFIVYENLSKKRFNILLNTISKEICYNHHLIEINISHATWILKDAYKKGFKADNTNKLKNIIKWLTDNIPSLNMHPIYKFMPDINYSLLKNITLSEVKKIFSHELMKDWSIISDVEALAKELKNIEKSPIILSEHQKNLRINEIKDKYRENFFAPEIFKNRFLEMAYYFAIKNEKEMALLCLKASDAFKKRDNRYKLITDYLLNLHLNDKQEEKENDIDSKLILSFDKK